MALARQNDEYVQGKLWMCKLSSNGQLKVVLKICIKTSALLLHVQTIMDRFCLVQSSQEL